MINEKDVDDFQVFKKQIGNNIKKIRKEKAKISQFKLSLMCDIDKNIPSMIEQASISIGLEILYKISKALKFHPATVMLDQEKDKDLIDAINQRYPNP